MFKKRGTVKDYSDFIGKHKAAMATATLMGTIIGAGILGIPYVIAKTGFLVGLILLVVLGLAFLCLNLIEGEMVLRTKKQHQLAGYAEEYLGKKGKFFATFAVVFGVYGALTAYLIGEGQALFSIFKVGSPLLYSLIFFALTFFIITRGIKATGKAELLLVGFLIVVVLLLGIFSYESVEYSNFKGGSLSNIFLAYGVIVFAYMGFAAIPEMQEELAGQKKQLKRAIIIGSVIPIIIYIAFSFFVIGIVGLDNFEALGPNEKIATVALSIYSSPFLGLLANVLAVLAMFTSYLTLSTALTEVYHFDYKLPHKMALALVLIVPLGILLLKITTFIAILGITGTVTGGIEGIVLVLSYWKAKRMGQRRPEYDLKISRLLGMSLIVLFVVGSLSALLRVL